MFTPLYSRRRFQPGFTLVELLVVIGVIDLLIVSLLPAINAAREAARTAISPRPAWGPVIAAMC